jgi:hypothetical protein
MKPNQQLRSIVMTENMPIKSLYDYEFMYESEDGGSSLTEEGIRVLREFADEGCFEVIIKDDHLVLFSLIPESGERLRIGVRLDEEEIGRINLYHVAGATAEVLKSVGELFALATVFRNIATLIDQKAMIRQYPSAEEFFADHVVPQIRPVFEEGAEEEE